MSIKLDSPLTLPSGAVIKNRIAKSAMSEALGTTDNHPTQQLATLYKAWAEGGTGLVITGNVMIDRMHLGEPNNVAIEDEQDLALLSKWAEAGKSNDAHIWVQLNHPGKQTPKILTPNTIAPSAIPFRKELAGTFATPRAMTEEEIQDVIQRFGRAAAIVKKAGFTGVQIHGAHGYLVSQFLSPHHNQRDDQWGGSLENRMRFAKEVYQSIRDAVGPDFPVGIKMNSADFQRGGFSEEDSMVVAETLANMGMDLIEISGGNYESPQMTGRSVKKSTKEREGYFMQYAESIRKRIPNTPLMVTGGFRSAIGMNAALASGATDFVGIARPLAVDPDLSNKFINDSSTESKIKPISTGVKFVDNMGMMEVVWYSRQLRRIANGKQTKPNESGLWSLLANLVGTGVHTTKTRRLRAR